MQILICNLLCTLSFQEMPGVVAFLSAKDIPGENSFIPLGLISLFEDEEVCCVNFRMKELDLRETIFKVPSAEYHVPPYTTPELNSKHRYYKQ